jgi:putative ABC transport system permease protein
MSIRSKMRAVKASISQALRAWSNAKATALVAAIAFAVGIGSTTAIYTVVHAVLLAPLPYANGDRFVALYGARFSEPKQFSSSTLQDVREYERRTTSFDVFGWFRLAEFNLTSPGEPQHVSAVAVTPALAQQLGAAPIAGQWFTDESGAVISSRLWRRLGADRAIVGRAITLDGRALTITGVMPPTFRLPVSGPGNEGFDADVWIALDSRGRSTDAGAAFYFAYARRKPGVTLEQADADVKRAAAEIAALDPAAHPSYTARLVDLRDASISGIRPTLLLLFAAAALLLVITCANVAGLLLARSVARARETATRVALGITQRQLALQYLTEGGLVSVAGAVAGVAASVGLVRVVLSIGSDFIPHADEIATDWTALAFALAMAALASALSSVAPLWQAFRISPIDVLNAGVRASAGMRVRRLSQTLVVAEVALAFTLLAVSGALIVHLRDLLRTAPGFDADRVLTFSVTIARSTATDDAAVVRVEKRIADAVAAVPGVTAAGFASHLPLTGCCFSTTIYREGHPIESRAVERTSYVVADPGFFRALKIPLRRGRFPTDADTSEDPLHVVLSQAAAARYWGDEDPVGSYGRFGGDTGTRFQVVGVAGDVRNNGLGNPSVPEIYVPAAVASANPMAFVVRSPIPGHTILSDVRRAIRNVDPTLPIHDVQTMGDIIVESMALERVGSLMTGFFAGAALLMATLGIYGLVSYSVRQRRVEIGTRMALGAVGRDVLALVIGSGLRLAAAGVVVGAVAVAGAIALVARVFELHDIGWLPWASSTAITATVAVAASSFPAWRATQLSPMVAIRDESQSALESARAGLRRTLTTIAQAFARDTDAARRSEAALLAEFAAAARRASSPAEQIGIALATLCDRLDAHSAWVLERRTGSEYRCVAASQNPRAGASLQPAVSHDQDAFALPSDGFLMSRLARFGAPLPMTAGDLDALALWAAEQKPARLREIEALRTAGVRLAAAIRAKDDVIGMLLLGPPIGRMEYGADDEAILYASAAQFALMIENARLTARVVEQEKLRRDLALAAEVQRRLLPERPPATSAAAFAAVSLPARSVGGDYFDFIEVGDRRIGIVLADVAGKGVAAALIMSSLRASLRILARQADIPLPELAATMNRFLHESTGSNGYATFFYAQIDERSCQLRYVNAGHLPPYLIRGSQPSIQELSTGGAVIGLFPEMAYEEATVDLRSGDLLVAFTDGVTEAMNESDEEFGEERLRQLLLEIAHLPVDEISTRISSELTRWIRNAAQYDDLTFVVLKVN